MNKSLLLLFSACLLGGTTLAQKQKKTYKEVYKVEPGAVLDINTAHADIVLDSWNKNQIEISAEIVLEGATEEEALEYFKENGLKIQGNSNKVEIKSGNRFFFGGPDVWTAEATSFPNLELDFNFSELAPIFEQLAIPELVDSIMVAIPEMPPMPPLKMKTFDYDKYKKEGKEYLRKWQSEFEESLDEDYQKKMEAWAKKFEEQAKKAEIRAEKMEERAALMEERAARIEEKAAEMEKRAAEIEKRAEEKVKRIYEVRGNAFFSEAPSSNRFFFRTNGDTRKFKVKTQIKIKMPKSVKLQLDVKHGEVTLASAEDMKANLSYARLLATRVDGKNTQIEAAYSPIRVEDWNAGQLKANYAERVDLLRVGQLNMDAVSSNVFIERLESSSLLSQQLGALEIKTITENCTNLDITTEHGEVVIQLPNFPMELYLFANASECQLPSSGLDLNASRNKKIYRGVLGMGKAKNNLSIQSQYSSVVLAQQ
ncbi:DUF4097 family beta strand repeat-containing protein [Aureicoccus marinus]|uniref:DUF4097 family beta strand repeat-containing protein n=1 Tax=Aureicoccus marinus TaxID=754435 RepID=UPI0011B001F6|nr:DUF4097 family beta strand repeat-containing protein [Aureicoccus marinus]